MTLDRIVSPFILRHAVNAERYLTMLRQEIWPLVSTWNNIYDLIFMQDVAPPHFAIVVCEWPNAYIPGRWMGHRGQTEILT